MKKSARRAIEVLESLDFRVDHDDPRALHNDKLVFHHPNQPDQHLVVGFKIGDAAAAKIIRHGEAIAGLSTSDDEPKQKPKANHRAKMERAAERQRRETARRLAATRKAEEEAQRARAAAANRYRELDGLLRGRDGGVSTDGIKADAMLTVAQVADATGVTDKAVQSAIESDRLTAYQCGKEVKVKGADVRAWVGSWKATA